MNAAEPTGETITVRVLKYDGREYRHWTAKLVRRDRSVIVLDGEFRRRDGHPPTESVR